MLHVMFRGSMVKSTWLVFTKKFFLNGGPENWNWKLYHQTKHSDSTSVIYQSYSFNFVWFQAGWFLLPRSYRNSRSYMYFYFHVCFPCSWLLCPRMEPPRLCRLFSELCDRLYYTMVHVFIMYVCSLASKCWGIAGQTVVRVVHVAALRCHSPWHVAPKIMVNVVMCTVEPLYCGHLGDVVKCPHFGD